MLILFSLAVSMPAQMETIAAPHPSAQAMFVLVNVSVTKLNIDAIALLTLR